jgi:hypothetical protein
VSGLGDAEAMIMGAAAKALPHAFTRLRGESADGSITAVALALYIRNLQMLVATAPLPQGTTFGDEVTAWLRMRESVTRMTL